MEYFFNVNTGRVEQRPVNTGVINVTDQLMQFDPNQLMQFDPNQTTQQIQDLNKKYDIVVGPDGSFLRQALDPPARMQPINTDDTASFFFPTDNTGITGSTKAMDLNVDPIAIEQGFVDTDEEEKVDFSTSPTQATGIAKLFEFLSRFTPVGLIRGGLESLKGLNQKIRDTDFARSRTLADYFATKRNKKFTGLNDPQGGVIPTFRNVKQQAQDKIDDRARGQIITRTPKSTRQIAPQSGMQAERTRTRDLGKMRGAIGR
jgi:hypothetical protein